MIRRYDYADKNYMIQSAIQIWVMIEIDKFISHPPDL